MFTKPSLEKQNKRTKITNLQQEAPKTRGKTKTIPAHHTPSHGQTAPNPRNPIRKDTKTADQTETVPANKTHHSPALPWWWSVSSLPSRPPPPHPGPKQSTSNLHHDCRRLIDWLKRLRENRPAPWPAAARTGAWSSGVSRRDCGSFYRKMSREDLFGGSMRPKWGRTMGSATSGWAGIIRRKMCWRGLKFQRIRWARL